MDSESTVPSSSNLNLFCNNCGHYQQKYCQVQCPFGIIIEDRSVKEVQSKTINVEANGVIKEFFEMKNLPADTFSVKIRKIKNEKSIEILTEGRILVQLHKQISVTFKFLESTCKNIYL